MSEVVVFDLVEQILERLDVIDLIRCKSVCKSWLSLISSNQFIKAHLNRTCNMSYELGGHRRLVIPVMLRMSDARLFSFNGWDIVGSSNGLVCFSPCGAQLLITNPCTRELIELQKPHIINKMRGQIFWGFGYDSSTDDYKVIVGTFERNKRSCFQVLTLKSNTWKFVGDVNYSFNSTRSGILYNGAIHWFMNDQANNKVILSFDLSSEEFNEIPQPNDVLYECNVEDHRLGVFEEYLCIYNYRSLSSNKWVMKKYNVQESWELLSHTMKYRVVDDYVRISLIRDGIHLPFKGNYIGGPIFVQSLVSPRINNNVETLVSPHNYIHNIIDTLSPHVYHNLDALVSPHVNNNGRPKKRRQKRINRRKRQNKKRKSKDPNLLPCKKNKKNKYQNKRKFVGEELYILRHHN